MQNESDATLVKVEAQHVGFFETPVAYCTLQNGEVLMRQLETAIRQNMKEQQGIHRSNFGGWHSETNMMEWGGPAAQELADKVVAICKRLTHFQEASADSFNWVVRMWANVSSKGAINHLHTHPGNLWAAVLYLDMGEVKGEPDRKVGGAFYIEDPRFPMSAMHNTAVRMVGANGEPQQYEIEFKLQRGNLVVFPAWLRHGVRPYVGDGERVSIAMNIDARRS